jgi:hypothetical protein
MTELAPGSRAVVITVSDRSSAGQRPDLSGPLAAELLAGLGFDVDEVVVVPDEAAEIEVALAEAIRAGVDLVVTTGGTGIAPRDVRPYRPVRSPAASPGCPGARCWSTCPARPVASVTAWRCSRPSSPTRSPSCVVPATTRSQGERRLAGEAEGRQPGPAAVAAA